jgi:hypothetical protein
LALRTPHRPQRHRFRRPLVGAQTLAAEWQRWVADNLLAGAAPSHVVDELSRRGVPRSLARTAVAELEAHPALAAARASLRSGRQVEMVRRLLSLQAKLAAHPSAIERRTTPSADELFDRYLATSTPAIFTDLVPRWPAFGRWCPELFRSRYGEVSVQITDSRESDPFYDARTEQHARTVRMDEFVTRVLSAGTSNDFYMVAKNRNAAQSGLAGLFDEVTLPSGWFREDQQRSSTALWFGPAGTITPLHHDASSILFCQIYGRKRWRMASPLETPLLQGARAMYSGIDPDRLPDSPALDVTFKDFVLEPGEALFIPAGWWHDVRALDVSISLGMNHFAKENNYDGWYTPGALP